MTQRIQHGSHRKGDTTTRRRRAATRPEPAAVAAAAPAPRPAPLQGARTGDEHNAQRRYPRYPWVAPVLARVLVEEETFRPRELMGRSRDISREGMLVEIEDLREEWYRVFIRKLRTARLRARFPNVKDNVEILGKIVWYDYHRVGAGGHCLMGVAFEKLGPWETEALEALLERLRKQGKEA